MRQIGLQQFFDRLRRLLRREVMIDFLSDIGVGTESAAREQMIALNCVVALADSDLGRDQANVADEVLGAGVVTAGQVDVERRVDFDARIAPIGNRGGVPLRMA